MRYLRIYEEFMDDIFINIDNDELLNLLNKYNIPLNKWGIGQSKTLAHLRSEIEEGESDLRVEDGKIIREVEFVGARVMYKKGGKWYRLYEDKQIFKNGRIRERNLPYSMAEKFKKGEDPKLVIIRGMEEELGIKVNKGQFVFYNEVNIVNNDDYPGIYSYHNGHEFLVTLNDSQYDPKGYIENQIDKDIFFVWKQVSTNESYHYKIKDGIYEIFKNVR